MVKNRFLIETIMTFGYVHDCSDLAEVEDEARLDVPGVRIVRGLLKAAVVTR